MSSSFNTEDSSSNLFDDTSGYKSSSFISQNKSKDFNEKHQLYIKNLNASFGTPSYQESEPSTSSNLNEESNIIDKKVVQSQLSSNKLEKVPVVTSPSEQLPKVILEETLNSCQK
ncbi:hypothetical protein NPIL_355831, partial [Nephila pilipes]